MEIGHEINSWFLGLLLEWGISPKAVQYINVLLLCIAIVIVTWLMAFIVRKVMNGIFSRIAKRTTTQFDNYLEKNKAITHFSRLIPLMFFIETIPVAFDHFPKYIAPILKACDVYFVIWFVMLLRSVLHSVRDHLKTKDAYKDKPIDSFIQIIIIIAYLIASIIIFSILTGKSVGTFLTAMGAASAIILLIFKDTILGFVASIQVSANDMVRIGDWITMEKYGADGDVVEINLATVKVQNFDKTITTIPTYYLISDSFKNWRGMQQSGGRRIKRAIRIKVSSIRYLTDEDVARLRKIQLITEYLDFKSEELSEYNHKIGADVSLPINGRRLTNIGVYRKYINKYIEYNENLHKGMTMMVRQLEPTTTGLPVELYVFTNDIRWQNYEHIMADLFDHLLAAVTYFDLEIFEMPNSNDVRRLGLPGKDS